jgi:glutamate racemase
VQETRNRRVGLMATEATVRSAGYQQALQVLDAGLDVHAVACPRLAPLIQGGDVFSEEVEQAVRGYVAPLKQAGVDTVILGCTHYPLITPMLRRLLGPHVSLVNSAEEIAREVVEILERKGIGNQRREEGCYRFYSTGDPGVFRTVGARFLQLPIREVTYWSGDGRAC